MTTLQADAVQLGAVGPAQPAGLAADEVEEDQPGTKLPAVTARIEEPGARQGKSYLRARRARR